MTQDYGIPPKGNESFTWSEVWINALTKPSVETYERLVRDPNASTNKAYGWVFICSLIGVLLSSLIGMGIGGLFDAGSIAGFNYGTLFGVSIFQLLCCAPIVGVLAVFGIALNAAITQLIARALGGTGTYSELVYAYAAYTAPYTLVTSILFAIPFVSFCLGIPLSIYSIVLTVISVNAVNKFGWGKAIVSAFVLPLVIIVLSICAAVFLLTLLGPTIGDVFSDIVRELSTPVP